MADPFMGEIRVFGFKFPPRGWAFCNGQLLTIQQNTAMFSLLGTTWGGDGRTTFALPDLQGRMPIGSGDGPGLSPRDLGESDGGEGVQLVLGEMPSHPHDWKPSIEAALLNAPSPVRSYAASVPNAYQPGTADINMAPQTIGMTGQSLPHLNIQPSLAISFCIALQGVFPKRP